MIRLEPDEIEEYKPSEGMAFTFTFEASAQTVFSLSLIATMIAVIMVIVFLW